MFCLHGQTEATHIILLDPVSGKPEEIAAIESQAIGRAHRQVRPTALPHVLGREDVKLTRDADTVLCFCRAKASN
jgi:hypothetical protein